MDYLWTTSDLLIFNNEAPGCLTLFEAKASSAASFLITKGRCFGQVEYRTLVMVGKHNMNPVFLGQGFHTMEASICGLPWRVVFTPPMKPSSAGNFVDTTCKCGWNNKWLYQWPHTYVDSLFFYYFTILAHGGFGRLFFSCPLPQHGRTPLESFRFVRIISNDLRAWGMDLERRAPAPPTFANIRRSRLGWPLTSFITFLFLYHSWI